MARWPRIGAAMAERGTEECLLDRQGRRQQPLLDPLLEETGFEQGQFIGSHIHLAGQTIDLALQFVGA